MPAVTTKVGEDSGSLLDTLVLTSTHGMAQLSNCNGKRLEVGISTSRAGEATRFNCTTPDDGQFVLPASIQSMIDIDFTGTVDSYSHDAVELVRQSFRAGSVRIVAQQHQNSGW